MPGEIQAKGTIVMYQGESLNVKPFTPELLPLAERFSSGNTYIDRYLQDSDSLQLYKWVEEEW